MSNNVTFNTDLARAYLPHRVVKQAILVPVPDGIESTITVDWGSGPEPQQFVGAWYGIYGDGAITYGSGRREFEETHDRAEEVENGWYKSTPIEAYQYAGPDARVVTVLSSGVIETENTATSGDWLVRWPHGEVGVMPDEKFRRLYQVD